MAKRKKDSEEPISNGNENSAGAEDNFGLPDIDYKPLDELKEERAAAPEIEETVQEESEPVRSYEAESQPKASDFSSYSDQEESKTPVIIGLVIALVVVVCGYLIYQFVYVPQAEKEKQELARIAAQKEKAEQERLAKLREEEARKRREAEAAATAAPSSGEIISLTEKTGRYYVVVASAVDGDLVMDYAKKLSATGTGSKIIPPFGKWKYYRIAISDHDTFANAQSAADQVKPTYGEATWVIRY